MMSSNKRQSLIYLCLVVVVCFKYADSQECKPPLGSTNKCACRYSDGATSTTRNIDFTPLAKNDGTAAFAYKDTALTSDYQYAYNPCFAFSDSFCTNTAACQKSQNGLITYPIGKPDDVKYTVGANSDIVITYTAAGGRSAVVNFHCDEKALTTATYQPFGDVDLQTVYIFTIGTCLACLKDVPNCHGTPSGGGSSGLTVGGVLCIIYILNSGLVSLESFLFLNIGGYDVIMHELFTVLLVVYIIGGILFQKFHRGATGKELVPNYGFWSDFPVLVKDGFMFLIGLCRGGSSGSDYEPIK